MRPSAIALVAVVAVLAGCDFGGSEAAKTTAAVVADTQHAIAAASSYHVSGSFTAPAGYGTGIEVWVANGRGAAGWIYPRGHGASGPYEVRLIGTELFLRGNFTALGGPKGKWLKGSATSGALAKLWRQAGPSKIFGILDPHSLRNWGLTSWGDNEDVVDLRSKAGGIAYVAAHGTPYPVAFVWDDRGNELNFSDWNGPVPLDAPKGAIDASRFGLG